MKNINSIYSMAALCFASFFLWSCSRADGESQGSEYMPDMAHSIAYEANHNQYYYNNTWGTEEEYYAFAAPKKPVSGTVARGYLPYKYNNLEDFRTSAEESLVEIQGRVHNMAIADTELKNPVHPTTASELEKVLTKGGNLYNIYCSSCHGEEGDGNGQLFKDGSGPYSAKPANYLNDEYSDGRIYNAIVHGKGVMQSHSDKLNNEERWLVVHYIRSLQAASKGETYDPTVKRHVNVSPATDSTEVGH